jgi:hypothetical protein
MNPRPQDERNQTGYEECSDSYQEIAPRLILLLAVLRPKPVEGESENPRTQQRVEN